MEVTLIQGDAGYCDLKGSNKGLSTYHKIRVIISGLLQRRKRGYSSGGAFISGMKINLANELICETLLVDANFQGLS